MARLAAILYSDCKHARWGVTGPGSIRSFIGHDLRSLKNIIHRMEEESGAATDASLSIGPITHRQQ